MLKNKKLGTKEEWKKLGKLLKSSKFLLTKASILSDKIMTKRECYQLEYAIDRLFHFIDNAEEIMWKQLPCNERGFNIFYGRKELSNIENPYYKQMEDFKREDILLPMEEQCPDMIKILYRASESYQRGVNDILENLGLNGIKLPNEDY